MTLCLSSSPPKCTLWRRSNCLLLRIQLSSLPSRRGLGRNLSILSPFAVDRTDGDADVTYELGAARLPSISAWLEVLAGPTLSQLWHSEFPLQLSRGARTSTILCAGFSLLALDGGSLLDSMALTSPPTLYGACSYASTNLTSMSSKSFFGH